MVGRRRPPKKFLDPRRSVPVGSFYYTNTERVSSDHFSQVDLSPGDEVRDDPLSFSAPASRGTWYSADEVPSELERPPRERNFDTAAGKLSVFFDPNPLAIPLRLFFFLFVSLPEGNNEKGEDEGERVQPKENRFLCLLHAGFLREGVFRRSFGFVRNCGELWFAFV